MDTRNPLAFLGWPMVMAMLMFLHWDVVLADIDSDLAHVRAAFDSIGLVRADGAEWGCANGLVDGTLRTTDEDGNARIHCGSGSSITKVYVRMFSTLTVLPDAFFTHLAALPDLSSMSLRGNGLTEVPAGVLFLASLETFALTENNLVSISPDQVAFLASLDKLKVIYLASNRLNSVADLSTLTALTSIYLNDNPDLSCVPNLPPGSGSFSTSGSFKADQAAIDGGVCPDVTPNPTAEPTIVPTTQPTSTPTTQPTAQPSSTPTMQPTAQPSSTPTGQPTAQPSSTPTGQPTSQPSSTPTTQPTSQPSSSESEECQIQTLIVLIRQDTVEVVQAGSFDELRKEAVEAFGDAITPATTFSYTLRLPAARFNAACETEVNKTILNEKAYRVAVAMAERTDSVLHLHIG